MARAAFVVLALSAAASPATAQSAADTAGIRQTIEDYVSGWYSRDARRMESALHPELAKRIVISTQNGSRLEQMSALTLIHGTRAGNGNGTPLERRRSEIRILDIFMGAATARADMADWVDYLHLSRWNGKWLIVNVLWELRQPEAQ